VQVANKAPAYHAVARATAGRLACKCITGKILIAENRLFENELNNSSNNEILNDKLCLGISCIGLQLPDSYREKRVGKLLIAVWTGQAVRWNQRAGRAAI